jgi:uncharacterized protein YggU (UPF0235/DUF167 family)
MHELLQGKTEIIVKVIPRSKKTEIIGLMSDGTLKMRIHALPEDGAANHELLTFLFSETHAHWEILY